MVWAFPPAGGHAAGGPMGARGGAPGSLTVRNKAFPYAVGRMSSRRAGGLFSPGPEENRAERRRPEFFSMAYQVGAVKNLLRFHEKDYKKVTRQSSSFDSIPKRVVSIPFFRQDTIHADKV